MFKQFFAFFCIIFIAMTASAGPLDDLQVLYENYFIDTISRAKTLVEQTKNKFAAEISAAGKKYIIKYDIVDKAMQPGAGFIEKLLSIRDQLGFQVSSSVAEFINKASSLDEVEKLEQVVPFLENFKIKVNTEFEKLKKEHPSLTGPTQSANPTSTASPATGANAASAMTTGGN